MYNGICDAGADWDNLSFNPKNTSDADCKVDPDFHFLDNVDKKVTAASQRLSAWLLMRCCAASHLLTLSNTTAKKTDTRWVELGLRRDDDRQQLCAAQLHRGDRARLAQ